MGQSVCLLPGRPHTCRSDRGLLLSRPSPPAGSQVALLPQGEMSMYYTLDIDRFTYHAFSARSVWGAQLFDAFYKALSLFKVYHLNLDQFSSTGLIPYF